jgi:hypothetical protein
VRLTVEIRDMVVASWRVGAGDVARVLSHGLEPAEIDGDHLVSAVFFRYARGRLGRVPVPRFSELNVRVYATWEGRPAAYFLDVRVTPLGKVAAPFLPVRATHLRVERGRAEGIGLELRYGIDGPVDPGGLGEIDVGLLPSAGLRLLRLRRGAAEWQRAELLEPARIDPILALGFDVGQPDELLYAARAALELDLPPERV